MKLGSTGRANSSVRVLLVGARGENSSLPQEGKKSRKAGNLIYYPDGATALLIDRENRKGKCSC